MKRPVGPSLTFSRPMRSRGAWEGFQQELRGLMVIHTGRRALIQRMVKAGIWGEA